MNSKDLAAMIKQLERQTIQHKTALERTTGALQFARALHDTMSQQEAQAASVLPAEAENEVPVLAGGWESEEPPDDPPADNEPYPLEAPGRGEPNANG